MAPTPTAELPAAVPEAEEDDGADALERQTREVHEALNPCRVCQVNQDEGPQGASHVFEHCWHCGYRPRNPVPAGVAISQPGLTQSQLQGHLDDMKSGILHDLAELLGKGGDPAGVTIDAQATPVAATIPPPPPEAG
jgi:hypothetical protein